MGVHYYILPLLYMFENFNNKLCKKKFEPHQNALFLVCDLWLPCEMKNYYFLVTSVTEVPREDLSSHKSHTSKKQLWWDFQR